MVFNEVDHIVLDQVGMHDLMGTTSQFRLG